VWESRLGGTSLLFQQQSQIEGPNMPRYTQYATEVSKFNLLWICRMTWPMSWKKRKVEKEVQPLRSNLGLHGNQYLTIVSLEIHAITRGNLRPNPNFDAVAGIYFCVFEDSCSHRSDYELVVSMIQNASWEVNNLSGGPQELSCYQTTRRMMNLPRDTILVCISFILSVTHASWCIL